MGNIAYINNLYASLYINYTKKNNGKFFYTAYYYPILRANLRCVISFVYILTTYNFLGRTYQFSVKIFTGTPTEQKFCVKHFNKSTYKELNSCFSSLKGLYCYSLRALKTYLRFKFRKHDPANPPTQTVIRKEAIKWSQSIQAHN